MPDNNADMEDNGI